MSLYGFPLDCSPSFAVGVVTDGLTDNSNKADDAANADRSRGKIVFKPLMILIYHESIRNKGT